MRSNYPTPPSCEARSTLSEGLLAKQGVIILLALLAQQESFLLCLRSKSPSCFACAARAPQGRVASQESIWTAPNSYFYYSAGLRIKRGRHPADGLTVSNRWVLGDPRVPVERRRSARGKDWLLATGYWLLAIGYWLRANGRGGAPPLSYFYSNRNKNKNREDPKGLAP